LQGLVAPDQQIEETIRRGKAAKEAGADGLFIPGLKDQEAIKIIAERTGLLIHVMAWEGLPNAAELGKLGVKRLSDGARLAAAVWKFAKETAESFIQTGDSAPLNDGNWELQQSLSK